MISIEKQFIKEVVLMKEENKRDSMFYKEGFTPPISILGFPKYDWPDINPAKPNIHPDKFKQVFIESIKKPIFNHKGEDAPAPNGVKASTIKHLLHMWNPNYVTDEFVEMLCVMSANLSIGHCNVKSFQRFTDVLIYISNLRMSYTAKIILSDILRTKLGPDFKLADNKGREVLLSRFVPFQPMDILANFANDFSITKIHLSWEYNKEEAVLALYTPHKVGVFLQNVKNAMSLPTDEFKNKYLPAWYLFTSLIEMYPSLYLIADMGRDWQSLNRDVNEFILELENIQQGEN